MAPTGTSNRSTLALSVALSAWACANNARAQSDAPSAAPVASASSSDAPSSSAPADPPTASRPLRRLPLQGRPIPVHFGPRSVRYVLDANPHWAPIHPAEYVVTGVGLVTAIVGSALPRYTAVWQGGIVADEATRSALRPSDPNVRGFFSDVSDVLLSLSITYPYLVDALTVAWWYRHNGAIAWQMAAIDTEAFAITAGVQAIVANIAARERPYGRTCGNDLAANTSECEFPGRYRSFFSGHTTEAFTSAALTCMHHAHMPLYGGGGAEVATCISGFALATTVGVFRVVSDNHYLSDVALGAAFGTLVGIAVPLLHYRGHTASLRAVEPPAQNARRSEDSFHAWLLPTSNGAALGGIF